MAESRDLRVGIITVFNPHIWLGVREAELASLPHLVRIRRKQEQQRIERLNEIGRSYWPSRFHGRLIMNDGETDDTYRKTWIHAHQVIPCMAELHPRLILTEELEQGPLAKLEFRPSWGPQEGTLPDHLRDRILATMTAWRKLSIRQLWINPVVMPDPPHHELYKVNNLMVGAIFTKKNKPLDLPQSDPLMLTKRNNEWWIRFIWNGTRPDNG